MPLIYNSVTIAPQISAGTATASISARYIEKCCKHLFLVRRIQKEINSLGSGLMLHKEIIVGYQTGAESPPKK